MLPAASKATSVALPSNDVSQTRPPDGLNFLTLLPVAVNALPVSSTVIPNASLATHWFDHKMVPVGLYFAR